MEEFKVNVAYNDEKKVHYYDYAHVEDEMPVVGDHCQNGIVTAVRTARPDIDNADLVWGFDYCYIDTFDKDSYEDDLRCNDEAEKEDYCEYDVLIAVPKKTEETEKKVWTMQEDHIGRDGVTVTDSFINDYETKEEAVASAQDCWYHLTASEREKTVLYVYEDVVFVDEDGEEEGRRSYQEGYDPILTFPGNGEAEC